MQNSKTLNEGRQKGYTNKVLSFKIIFEEFKKKKKKGNEKGNPKCIHLIRQVNYIYPCDFGETVSAQNWLPL